MNPLRLPLLPGEGRGEGALFLVELRERDESSTRMVRVRATLPHPAFGHLLPGGEGFRHEVIQTLSTSAIRSRVTGSITPCSQMIALMSLAGVTSKAGL